MQYEILPFQIITDVQTQDVPIVKEKAYYAPYSGHMTEQKYKKMTDAGWNKTILPKYTFKLGNR